MDGMRTLSADRIDTGWGTSGSKTGKTLSVSNTDVDTKATFMCVVIL